MPSPRSMKWPFRAGRRTRLGWPCVLTVLALFATGLVGDRIHADDEEPGRVEEPQILLAPISTDPEGGADLLVIRARQAVLEGELDDVFQALLQLAEDHPDVVVPVAALLGPNGPEGDGALRWPARRVANIALARLPELAARIEGQWGPEASVLFAAGERGDPRAWTRLAADYGALDLGARTLLFLADADLEAGRYVRAARRFELWLLYRPYASAAARAAVFARLADALDALDDAGGLDRLEVRAEPLLDVSLSLGGDTVTLRRHLSRARRGRTSPSRRPTRVGLPDSLDLLWRVDLDEPSWVRDTWAEFGFWWKAVRAGAYVEADTLVLHGGRTVRRLDTVTGVERWRFPADPKATIHAPDIRYWAHDVPYRAVTRAGDVVLCLLGEPGATGSYEFLAEKVEAKSIGIELRMRLVALDLATGALRWFTGGPTETHPVLGDRATGCASPPLVVGDRVYAVFARRHGVGEYHLACLDLGTGAPIWVRRLAIGESGRAEDRSDDDRFVGERLQALAFGARPAYADGEVLAVPHAGFAAGVDAETGKLGWIRALPRYAFSTDHGPMSLSGHAAQNEPVAWGDAWVIAPMDSPRLICLERGSGALRWHTGPGTAEEHPLWRHFHGVGIDPKGRPAVELSGYTPILLDARDPNRAPLNGVDLDELRSLGDSAGGLYLASGRGLVEDRIRFRIADSVLEGALIDAPDATAPEPVRLPDQAPKSGTVLRAGDVWIAIGERFAVGLAARPDVLERAETNPTDPVRARDAVAAAIQARWTNKPAVLDVAFDRAASIGDEAHRAAAYARIAEELERWLKGLWTASNDAASGLMLSDRVEALSEMITRLPPDLRGVPFFFAIEALIRLGRNERAIERIEAWIDAPGTALVPYPPPDPDLDIAADVWLRGDLVAVALLERVRASVSGEARLTEHEQEQDRRVTDALDADVDTLREAIRRAAGTEAATVGRRRLRDRYLEAGDLGSAAAIEADQRLDPAPRERGQPSRLLRTLAKHQLQEASLLRDLGELGRARSLLVDLSRWAPPGTNDVRGRSVAAVLTETELEEGRRPAYTPEPQRLDLWKHLDPPKERDQISSVQVLPVRGPGAALLGDRIPVARGLTFELWSAIDAGRIATLPGEDEGWFGGSLHAVDGWVPGAGILVTSVVAGEPADRSTVRAGDWIRSWNGSRVPDLSNFMRAVAAAEPGETIDIEVYRDGRLILDRFRAGRRPIEQRAGLAYAPLWAAEDGRLLLPGRTGLSWVDPRLKTRATFWRWEERGVIMRTEVLAGACYVWVQRNLEPDVVVRVDLESGTEVWRAEIEGRITRLSAVGSALWVDAREPSSAFVVDRHDGSLRARYRVIPCRRDEYRRTWTQSWTSDASPMGWGFAVCGYRSAPEILFVNTTTGRPTWSDSWDSIAGDQGYLNPCVSADGVVSAIQGRNELILWVPDPTGRAPTNGEKFIVGPDHLRTNAQHGGPIDDNTRVHVKGNTIHVVRNSQAWQKVTVWTLRVNFERVRGTNTNVDPTQPDPVELKINERILTDVPPGSSQSPYVLHIVPEFDGVYVTAATLANEPYVEVWFVSEHGSEHLLMEQVNEGRRHGPVRIGETMFVPVDRGAVVVPLERIPR